MRRLSVELSTPWSALTPAQLAWSIAAEAGNPATSVSQPCPFCAFLLPKHRFIAITAVLFLIKLTKNREFLLVPYSKARKKTAEHWPPIQCKLSSHHARVIQVDVRENLLVQIREQRVEIMGLDSKCDINDIYEGLAGCPRIGLKVE